MRGSASAHSQERLRPRRAAELVRSVLRRVGSIERRASAPEPPSGRIASTATPSVVRERQESSRSHSRSHGLYGTCSTSKRRVASARSSVAERRGRVVRDPEAADAAGVALLLEPRRGAHASATRLCTCSISIARRTTPSWRRSCSRPSSTEVAQIFVATVASGRRAPSAAASVRSASRYIGEVSKIRASAENAASATCRASETSPSNVLHVPRPTTGTEAALLHRRLPPGGRRRRARASRRPSPRDRRRRCARRVCGSSSCRSRGSRTASPRSLNTFASAAPPDSVVRDGRGRSARARSPRARPRRRRGRSGSRGSSSRTSSRRRTRRRRRRT